MAHRALIPFKSADPGLSGLPVEVFAAGDPVPGDLESIEFFVPTYNAGPAGALIDRMPALRIVQTLTAGYESVIGHIRDGMTLCNGRGLHDASTSEHALALILAARRQIPRWVRDGDAHRWDPEIPSALGGSTVLIVGYGSIGVALGRRIEACEARVLKVASRARDDIHGVDELLALLPDADIVVLILPLTVATDRLFGARELSAMRDGSLLVNVGRGRVLDTEALVAQRGRILAALDVTDPEPLPADHPLWDTPGVLITPHIAGGSALFHPRAVELISQQLRRFDAGEELANVVAGPRRQAR